MTGPFDRATLHFDEHTVVEDTDLDREQFYV